VAETDGEARGALEAERDEDEKASAGEASPAEESSPVIHAEADAPKVEPASAAAESVERTSRPDAVQATAVVAEEESPRPRKAEEALDASGVSAEFFRDDEASLAPTIEDVPDEPAMRVVLSPATLARRARFRRVVAGVVAFTGVISLAVIGKSIAAPRKQAPVVAAMTVAAPPVVEAPKTESAAAKVDAPPAPTPTAAADEKKAEDAKPAETADVAPAADEKKVDDKDAKTDEKKADAKDEKKDEPAGEPDPAAAKKLQQETLSLLNRGRSKEAIEKAREAIAADPTDAIAYLYLGSALQDSGHWKDGIDAYSDCVRHATKGSVNECRVMGGHK
jgi:hypothetical protein